MLVGSGTDRAGRQRKRSGSIHCLIRNKQERKGVSEKKTKEGAAVAKCKSCKLSPVKKKATNVHLRGRQAVSDDY